MRMPVVFFGHGSPMIALQDNAVTQRWRAIAQRVEQDYGRPRAILCVSAHWLTRGTAVTAMNHPRTIHDFGAFPQALFDVQYPAPGDPDLAARVASLLEPIPVTSDTGAWGLDHGTWSVLCKAWPDADIPVVQLSLDGSLSPRDHHALGQRLRPLRDEGVLIIGTGNIVHNLRMMNWNDARCTPYPWAQAFEDAICAGIETGDDAALINFVAMGEPARLSVPSPDHYWPLLYTAGAADADDTPELAPHFIEHASLSMTSIAWWPSRPT
jgi:4,5-DOPA dioxygenase extradiol